MSTVDVPGGEIYYEVEGNGDLVVLVHGFSLDHRMWNEQVAFLKSQYQVISYDMRGFGRSSMPIGAYSHADDLKVLLDQLGVDTAHMVGLSLGGEVALDFCVAYPDMVRTLTVIDSAVSGLPSSVDWSAPRKAETVEKAKQIWMNHEVFAYTSENKEVSDELEMIVADYSGWHWFHDNPVIRLGAVNRLSEIRVPVLCLVGEHDLEYFHDIAKVLEEKIVNIKVVKIAKAGHMSNMEQPEVVNQLLLEQFEAV